MKYWNYPAQGTGFHSYNHPTYGTLSANFAATTYDWGAMPNSLTGPNLAIATLMYHCGVAVEMDYGVDGSGSYVIIAASPTPEQCCEYAYKTYFGYDPSTLQGLKRANYSDNEWKQLIKNDLDQGRPVQYAGFGAGGHTFVCDGYDVNGYFHINWGWSGIADGYFLLDALNPGAGMGTYNSGQQAVIGIKPLTGGTTYNISLYDNVIASPNPVGYNQSFTIHTDIANYSTSTFEGDFCAAVFDENVDFVSFVEILSGCSLPGNSHYTNGLDFTSSGSLSLLPGAYYIGIFFRPAGGDWIMVDDGSYSNMISFAVNNSNDIELYQEMVLSCGDNIIQEQPFTVTLDVANYGTATFNGMFDVSLYNADSVGSFAENIATLTGASLEPGYFYDDLQFSTDGVSVSPGTYLLALTHKEEGGNWQLTGSTYHPNPITVIVQEPGIIPDSYENNDSLAAAYALTLNAYHVLHITATTTGSNIHKGSDRDYYKIVLPSGFDYSVTARAQDSYSSNNGYIYSCDVVWLYLAGSTWSDAFDDVMSGSINVTDGGTVYFQVVPYFAGETGSYLLDIDISKSAGGGIKEAASSGFLSVFPNPADDVLYIRTEKDINISNLKIFDALGRLVAEVNNPAGQNHCIAVPVSNLATGAYVLLLQTDGSVWQQKFVKTAP
ncbi:MAG TPA: C10 family peptidase [Bacteroidales bacterium]|nr:C10 family peptidase [Bacteroidales bacterium]